MSMGYALSASSPSPAVRLVPANKTILRPDRLGVGVVCAALDFSADGCVAESARAAVSLGLLHAAIAHTAAVSSLAVARFTLPASLFPLMLVARDLAKEYRSGENRLTVLRDVNF